MVFVYVDYAHTYGAGELFFFGGGIGTGNNECVMFLLRCITAKTQKSGQITFVGRLSLNRR